MKVKIIVDRELAIKNNIPNVCQLGEQIPVPEGKDAYISVPSGVFRCNINEGVFPEDRIFFQKSTEDSREEYVIKFSEMSHEKQPVLSIKEHYPGHDEDVQIEFR